MGLFFLFVGERLLGSVDGIHGFLVGTGAILALAATAARGYAMASSSGSRRRVETALLACQVTGVVGLVLYMLTTGWGPDSMHGPRAVGVLTVLWIIAMVASIVPLLMIELSLGAALRTGFDPSGSGEDDAGVEFYRVRDIGWSGLAIAFALSLLMVTCNVAKERNVQKDVSYFKTSEPGESNINIVKSMTEPLHVYLFFPEANEVKDQVMGYFEKLNAEADGKVIIEVVDRFRNMELAKKFGVGNKTDDKGIIAFARGEGEAAKVANTTIEMDTDLEKARKSTGKLRNLDKDVNERLSQVARDKRKIYLIKGHGEVNDPETMEAETKKVLQKGITQLRLLATRLNYEIKDLDPSGLAARGENTKDVPQDATMVFLLAPMSDLDDSEWDTLDRYLARGGRLFIALDPTSKVASMGALEGRLGIKYDRHRVLDDKNYKTTIAGARRVFGPPAAYMLVATSDFTNHAVTTAVARTQNFGVVESGSFDEIEFDKAKGEAKRTTIIRSSESSWVDLNDEKECAKARSLKELTDMGCLAYEPATEKRGKRALATVVEGNKTAEAKDGFRAVLFGDVDLFIDVPTPIGGFEIVSGMLVRDAIRWLGGEEVFAGTVVSEDDVAIQHTKKEDAVWFTLTTIGGPILTLTLGLLGTWLRRRRAQRKPEVTP
ncbi:MAG: Gldg family protein [Deltaproteobacteria bacterium]|nr:Gldg family protein [Deltaproteobacteria bacterium]